MVDEPEHHFDLIQQAGGDSVTFHFEAVDDPRRWRRRPASKASRSASRSIPRRRSRRSSGGRRLRPRPLHEHPPGLLGPGVHARSARPDPGAPRALPAGTHVQVDGGITSDNIRDVYDAGADLIVAGPRSSAWKTCPAPTGGSSRLLAHEPPQARARARRARAGPRGRTRSSVPSSWPTARSSARAGTSGKGGPHAEVVALEEAGERARGATLYVTMEPCGHHGTTPPCTEAVIRPGSRRSSPVARPEPGGGGGLEVLRAAGVEVEHADSFEAGAERGLAYLDRRSRPFVTLKLAATLDGRVTVPGARWVSGEESRRFVHELRAAADAVAVGMGTVRADDPQLTARDVDAVRQPRRLASVGGRCRTARSSSCVPAPSKRSWPAWPPRECSRCCSRAGRRSRPRSSSTTWSTRCSSSSPRRSPAAGPRCSARFPAGRPEPFPGSCGGRGRAAQRVRPRALSAVSLG